MMDIKRFRSVEAAIGEPLVEIRAASDGRYLLSVMFDDDEASYLDGPFPTAASAEAAGIALAQARGLATLHIVDVERA